MIDILRDRIATVTNDQEKIHLLREELQLLILQILYDLGASSKLVFMGGTALRILHQIDRYSEDLDFIRVPAEKISFDQLSSRIEKALAANALPVETKSRDGVVQKCEVRVKSLLHQLGLSPHQDEKLMIRLEVDTNPPEGGNWENHILRAPSLFMVRAFDLPSIMAGKLCAILCRKYVKSRDYYDLLWFLSRRVEPNSVLLRNAVRQTSEIDVESESWRNLVLEKLSLIDLDAVRTEVRRFLQVPKNSEMLTMENFRSLLSR